ncbi:MAG: glycosyltransferase family 4 protein [Lentisphaerota bacterium]
MKIALAHFRVGETDGVSLEMDKWKIALEKLGHSVFYIAGSKGTSENEVHIIPELHYMNEQNNRIAENAYKALKDYDAIGLENEIESISDAISFKINEVVRKNNIDMIVPNNIWSLGWGLPAGLGFYKSAKSLNIKWGAHHHDFSWEREKYSNPTIPYVKDLIVNVFPPGLPGIKHVVINSLAKNELEKRRGIKATIVPNVFDFEAPMWKRDDYNSDFRQRLGLKDSDIVILQGTRIVERKAIELAIDVAGGIVSRKTFLIGKKLWNGMEFNAQSRIVLFFAGLDESTPPYLDLLKAKAKDLNVELLFGNQFIEHSRTQKNCEKIYSLWDAYVYADLITYPSVLEGWGNQFLEGLFAKVPMVVYEYPVFESDIKSVGFEIVSLGSRHKIDANKLVHVEKSIIDKAGEECVRLLIDGVYRSAAVEKNFKLGLKNYSYSALSAILEKLFRG